MAATVAGVVRQRLVVAGFDPDGFDVATAGRSSRTAPPTREGLMTAALEALEASAGGAAANHAGSTAGASTEPAADSA